MQLQHLFLFVCGKLASFLNLKFFLTSRGGDLQCVALSSQIILFIYPPPRWPSCRVCHKTAFLSHLFKSLLINLLSRKNCNVVDIPGMNRKFFLFWAVFRSTVIIFSFFKWIFWRLFQYCSEGWSSVLWKQWVLNKFRQYYYVGWCSDPLDSALDGLFWECRIYFSGSSLTFVDQLTFIFFYIWLESQL